VVLRSLYLNSSYSKRVRSLKIILNRLNRIICIDKAQLNIEKQIFYLKYVTVELKMRYL